MLHDPRRAEADRPLFHRLAHQPRHLGDIFGGGGLVGEGAIAHYEDAEWRVGDLEGDVHGVPARLDLGEIVAEAPPRPVEPLVEDDAGDVLDALHHLDQLGPELRPRGRESDAAIARHHRRDAVGERRVERVVPHHLPVVMGVDFDEAGGHDLAGGVDRLVRIDVDPLVDGDDMTVFHAHVRAPWCGASPIDEHAITNEDIEHAPPPRRCRAWRPVAEVL